MNFPSLDDFRFTLDRLVPYINKTPIISSKTFNNLFDLDIYFKLELFQKTGSLKPRCALNKILKLNKIQQKKGVIAISAGNHAQATAWACSQF